MQEIHFEATAKNDYIKIPVEKKNRDNSPVRRLLNLSGVLENPAGLNAKQYKQQVIDEYLSQRK